MHGAGIQPSYGVFTPVHSWGVQFLGSLRFVQGGSLLSIQPLYGVSTPVHKGVIQPGYGVSTPVYKGGNTTRIWSIYTCAYLVETVDIILVRAYILSTIALV